MAKKMTRTETCNDCSPRVNHALSVKTIRLCTLHAAAPALLTALEEAVEWRDKHDSYMLPGPWFFTARAAIEEARK